MTKSMPALKRVSSINRAEAQCHCVKAHMPECATGENIQCHPSLCSG